MVSKQKKLNSTWHGKDSNKIRQYCSLRWNFLVVPLPMSLYFLGLQYKITNSRGESAGFPRFFSRGNSKLATWHFLSDSNSFLSVVLRLSIVVRCLVVNTFFLILSTPYYIGWKGVPQGVKSYAESKRLKKIWKKSMKSLAVWNNCRTFALAYKKIWLRSSTE